MILSKWEMGGNKLNGGDEGSEKDRAEHGSLWDASAE